VETTYSEDPESPSDLIEQPRLIVHQSCRPKVPLLLLLFTSFLVTAGTFGRLFP
jgi:hypothetical protein